MAQQNDVIVTLKLQGAEQFKSQANGALSSVSKSSSLGAKAFKALGAAALTASAVAVTALVAISKNGIRVAADLESARMGFVTLLGSTKKADDAIKRIVADAARTPFEITGLMQANLMLTQVTKNSARSEAVLLNVGKALAAAGKGGAELDRVILNLQQISNTGKITELDIRQFGFAGINILELLADYYGTTKDKAVEMVKNSKDAFKDLEGAFEKAGTGSGQFALAFSNQAGTMNQLISNLKDSWNIFTAEFVKSTGIFDLVKQAVTKFTETLNWIQTVLPGIISQGKDNWNAFMSAFTDSGFFEYIKAQFESWSMFMQGLSLGFQQAWTIIKPVLMQLGAELNKMFGLAAGNADSFKITMQVVGKIIGIVLGGIVLAVASVATGITKAVNAAIWMRDKMGNAAQTIKDSIGGAIKYVGDKVLWLQSMFGRLYTSVKSGVSTVMKNAMNSVISTLESKINGMIDSYNAIKFLPDVSRLYIPRFATGGVVAGNSTSGDKVLARVNSGEMILNKGQQGALFNMLKNMSSNQNINFNAPISFGNQSGQMQQENSFINLLGGLAR